MILDYLNKIEDHRRNQSKHYDLGHMLLFVILWILSGCSSYRELESFIKIRFVQLKEVFWIKWTRVPDYSTIRNMILEVNKDQLERELRNYAKDCVREGWEIKTIAIDWKTMRWSFDNFIDQRAIQMLSAYLWWKQIILWHRQVENNKTNEIPEAQRLIEELWLQWYVYTLDALHTQKKQWNWL